MRKLIIASAAVLILGTLFFWSSCGPEVTPSGSNQLSGANPVIQPAQPRADGPTTFPEAVSAQNAAEPALPAPWRNSEILESQHLDGNRIIVRIQPADLPYPVELRYASDNPGAATAVAADRFMIKLDGDENKIDQLRADPNIQEIRTLGPRNWHLVVLADSAIDSRATTRARLHEHFPEALIEEDPIVRAFLDPDDPGFAEGNLWGLHNTGQDGGKPGIDIRATEGWEMISEAPDLIVGVVDSGIRYTHEDLEGNVWINSAEIPGNGIDDDENGYVDDLHGINAILGTGDPMDDHGHGTHVSGTIGAVGNNGIGSTGVAWSVRIMGLKFLGANGSGTLSDAIECLQYGRENGVRVFNNSWGGGMPSQAMADLVSEFEEDGILLVMAAGNSSNDNSITPTYPANLPHGNIISVAAHDRHGELAEFTNFGNQWVHLSAPGVAVYSLGHKTDQAYAVMRGTSMAAPHVTGVLALLQQAFPGDSGEDLMNRLLNGATRLESHDSRVTGNRALDMAGSLTAPPLTPQGDLADDPIPLPSSYAYARLSLAGATRSPDETDWPQKVGQTIWLEWNTSVSGKAIIETLDSGIDTVVRIYDRESGEVVAENDDILGTVQSRVEFQAVAERAYLIGVGAPDLSFGAVILNAAGPPENDHLSDAGIIPTTFGAVRGTSRNAGMEPGEPDHAGAGGGASVWFKWQPELSARWILSTRRSGFDTILALYEGPEDAAGFDELTLVAENNDIYSGLRQSELKFDSISGSTYYIAIGDVDELGGEYVMTWRQPPLNDDFPERFTLFGETARASGSTAGASVEPGEPAHHPEASGNSVWWEWEAPRSGDYRFHAKGSFAGTVIAAYTGDTLPDLKPVASDFNSGPGASSEIVIPVEGGQRFQLAVDAGQFFPGSFELTVEPILRPPNDAFANAESIPSALPVTVYGSNVGAGPEPDEPGFDQFGQYNTIWYRWVPQKTMRVRLSTKGSDFSTNLRVFQGSALDSLNPIATADFARPETGTELVLVVNAGQPILIRISGHNNESGNLTLSLEPFTAPENDRWVDALPISPNPSQGNSFVARFSSEGATREPGEPYHSYDFVNEIDVPGTTSLWWKYTPRHDLTGTTTVSAIGPGATSNSVAVYTGSTLRSLQRVAKSSRYKIFGSGQLAFDAEAGQTYYIAVAGNWDSGTSQLTLQAPFPANSPSGAYRLTGRSPVAAALNINATKESGERFHSGNRGGRSIWFDWTAPVSGTYRIATAGSTVLYSDLVELDTLLSVYSGDRYNNLSLIAENEDRNPFDQTSEVVIVTEAGTRFWVAVDGRNPTFGDSIDPEMADQGFIRLAVTPVEAPTNDAFAEAVDIPALPYQTVTPVAAATVEPGEPVHDGKRKRSVWYRWTAPRSGTVVAGTNGNQYDNFRAQKTGIAVYTGSAVDALAPVSLSPGFPRSGGNGARVLRFNAVAGTSYYFATDDVGTAAASNLAFFLDYAPANDAFEEATVLQGSRVTAYGHNIAAGMDPGEPVVPDGSYINPDSRPDPASVWWRWTAPASGSARIDTFGSEIYSVMAVYTGVSLDNLVTIASRDSGGRDPINGADRARSGTAFLNLTVTAGTTYHIQVYGDYYDRSSQGPITLTIEAPRGAPAAPDTLALTPVGPESIFLEWPDVPDAAYFRIERRPGDQQPWSGIGSLVEESSVTDTGLIANTAWSYRIRAENESGASPWTYAGPATTLRNALEAWRRHHFERIDNAGLAANNADPDEDGLPNAIEFWLGLNPRHTSAFPALTPDFSGEQINWELPPVPEPLHFSVVGSADLKSWTPLPASAVSGNPRAAPWILRTDFASAPFWALRFHE